MSSDPNSSYPYTIHHEKLSLHLKILDINSLFLHEETIPKALQRLTAEIERDNIVKHPIIVDEVSFVVLDGMHRVAALKKLNCKRIPVCLVDYKNPSITVGAWYRTIIDGDSIQEKLKEIEDLGFKFERSEIKLDEIGKKDIIAAIKTLENSYLIHYPFKNLKEAYDYVKYIEEKLKQSNFRIGYETEVDALKKLEKGLIDGVLFTPKLSKADIIKTALSGKVFSYKATRHIIPARPLYVNVPLRLLTSSNLTLDQVNEEFKRMLTEKKLKVLPAGSLIENRRYEEDVYLFEG